MISFSIQIIQIFGFFWSTCQQTICIIFTLTNLIYCNGFPFSFNFLIILKSAKFTLKGLIFIWNLNRWEVYQPLTLASQFLYVKLKLFGPINEKKGHYYCKIHNKLFHTNYKVFWISTKRVTCMVMYHQCLSI
jgi:hypothetical protein